MVGIAMAQPAMMTKGNKMLVSVGDSMDIQISETRDVLHPEIVGAWDYDSIPHPETPLMCPAFNGDWTTRVEYSWYIWETSWEEYSSEYPTLWCLPLESGYIKVTVGDNEGNTGVDSIWFNVKSTVSPMQDFIMEIGDDLYPTFSGIATPEHYNFYVLKSYSANNFGWDVDFLLSPGQWSWTDEDAHYSEDSLWVYRGLLFDTCRGIDIEQWVPGMLLKCEQVGSGYFLDMHTLLQTDGQLFQDIYGIQFVYFVYTVDQYGNRHHFIQNGEPVVLPDNATRWEIPGEHIDPYYQCGISQVLDDGSYKLVSLSNKIPNPLLDPTGLTEVQDLSVSVYPNPNNGTFTVLGNGILRIVDLLGQSVLSERIDGEKTVTLPVGMYFVSVNESIRKVIVDWTMYTLCSLLQRVFL